MTPETRERLEEYWAARLGVDVGALSEPGLHVVPTRGRAYLIDFGGAVVAAAPEEFEGDLRRESPRDLVTRDVVAKLFPGASRLIGPAFIGYAEEVAAPERRASEIRSARDPAFDALRRAVAAEEWEHAGLDEHVVPIFTECVEGRVVAAAGYAVIAGEVAHIGVLTDPAYRGGGRGRRVVAAAARCAIACGLLAQYQTLLANTPAISVARALGFEPFATTFAARLS